MYETRIFRCPWGDVKDATLRNYHDHEWGKLNLDDQYLYEMLVLELFQSGLSWATILHKRENFRKAFKDFDAEKMAQMTDYDVGLLMQDKGIIRNHIKINAAIKNAKAILAVKKNTVVLPNTCKTLSLHPSFIIPIRLMRFRPQATSLSRLPSK